MTAKTGKGRSKRPAPEVFYWGKDACAVARWRRLREWFEAQTGIGLGPIYGDKPEATYPPSFFPSWPDQDAAIADLADDISCANGWTALDLMRRAGPQAIKRANEIHRRLQDAARIAYNSRDEQWGWGYVANPELRHAVNVILSADFPYPVSAGRGHRPFQSIQVQRRREIIRRLDSLRKPGSGSPLSTQELTVLYLLWDTVGSRSLPENPWQGVGTWTPPVNHRPTEAEAILESEGFRRLMQSVEKDRSPAEANRED